MDVQPEEEGGFRFIIWGTCSDRLLLASSPLGENSERVGWDHHTTCPSNPLLKSSDAEARGRPRDGFTC